MPPEAPATKRSFWPRCRVYFRRCRITVWILIVLLLGALLYLNQIGLPDFLKRPLQQKLRERGVSLDFASLRLHLTDGFVAHEVVFGATREPAAPELRAKEVQIKFSFPALWHGQFQVDSLGLRGGQLEWHLAASNSPLVGLSVSDIGARLRFLPQDQWQLDDLRARFAGADFLISASVTNATAIRDWEFLKGKPGTAPATAWPARLQQLADTLATISFTKPPDIRLIITGDARDLASFSARFNLAALGAHTPWGTAQRIEFKSHLSAATSNELSRVDIDLIASGAQTPWAATTNLEMQLRLVSLAPTPEVVSAAVTLRAGAAETPWASVGATQLKAEWVHTITNPIPLQAHVEIDTAKAFTKWAQAVDLRVTASLAANTNAGAARESLGLWTNLWPYQVEWAASARAAKTEQIVAGAISGAGSWLAPHLVVSNVQAQLYRGSVAGGAALAVDTRQLTFRVASDFDVQQLGPLLPPAAREWLARISWSEPPHLQAAGAVTLPAWQDPQPDWAGAVRPTLQLAGALATTNVAFQELHAQWARTQFTYTNLVWHLPDLEVQRADGALRAEHRLDEATRDYYFKFHSTIDPMGLRSVLGAEVQKALDLCELTTPPVVDLELWGRGLAAERLGFQGHVALTNFSFRQQTADALLTDLHYTNKVLACTDLRGWLAGRPLSADGVVADFNSGRVYFTNGYGEVDPRMVTRAIGPLVDHVMSPYHFITPPTVHVSGYVPMHDPHDADVLFEGEVGAFESLRFRVPHGRARVHWLNDTLTVTNVQADFYGGYGEAWAHFVFPEHPGSDFKFSVSVTNANLRSLMTDLTGQTNQLDGTFDLNLAITAANTEDLRSWNGYGAASLRDGLLWEIPIFGVLSKPLDAIAPGVGNSKFTEAKGDFNINNSVIASRNFEMRAPTMRLQYRGTVDFNRDIAARVTAEPLRDTPIIGPMVNVALWPVTKLFEYKITGTLSDPKSEPMYIPKILLLPLSPFQTLGNLFGGGEARTNAPPEIK